MDHVQTKREIEAVLAAHGLRPRNRFGQNFLIDGNLMRKLVESAEISSSDLVLEVGPGTGGLTDLLCERAGRVLCVEIDRDLAGIMSDRFEQAPNVEIVCTDALAAKHRVADPIASAIDSFDADGGGAVKLVANLPYQIATPLVMNLVVAFPAVRRLCFTVQAEVGDRLIASPGSKEFGPLAIMTQLMFSSRVVARLGPASFWPRPLIDSVMMRMDAIQSPFESVEQAQACAAFVRRVFEYRRKTLRGALGYIVEKDVRELLAENVDLTLRPEQISVAQWLQMSRVVQAR